MTRTSDAPVYACEPGSEEGHVDIVMPPLGLRPSKKPRPFWTKGLSGRTYVVYACDVGTALARLHRGIPKTEFPWTFAWELWDTPLPAPARATGAPA